MNRTRFALTPAVCVVLLAAIPSGCGKDERTARSAAVGNASADKADADPLAPHRGKVLLLLMGMPGCQETARATKLLSEYAAEKPADVAILRLDVPPPDGELDKIADWSAPFERAIDQDRKVADRLDFFYYPTFYVLDREGGVRFSGGCRASEVRKMATEILAEKPGGEKKVYTPPLPKVGAQAEDFSGAMMDGKPSSLKELRGAKATLLYFGSNSCPFSADGVAALPKMAADFKAKGAAVAVVNVGKTQESDGEHYSGKAPGVPVFVDADERISKEKYGIQAVPFFYVLDAGGRIAARQPFTEDAARDALASALGMPTAASRPAKTGAG